MEKKTFTKMAGGHGNHLAILAALLVFCLIAESVTGDPVVVAGFEPGGTPQSSEAFSFVGPSGRLEGGSADAQFGEIPLATEGTHLFGMAWNGDDGDDKVEIGLGFADPGLNLADYDWLLIDVCLPRGVLGKTGMGIWVTDIELWRDCVAPSDAAPEAWGVWKVPISDLDLENLSGLNLTFVRAGTSGRAFVDNVRLAKNGDLVAADRLGTATSEAKTTSGATITYAFGGRPDGGSGGFLQSASGSANSADPAKSGKIVWVSYNPLLFQQELRSNGKAIVYFRASNMERCKLFEKFYLLHPAIEKYLGGEKIFYIDVAETPRPPILTRLEVHRAPALILVDSTEQILAQVAYTGGAADAASADKVVKEFENMKERLRKNSTANP